MKQLVQSVNIDKSVLGKVAGALNINKFFVVCGLVFSELPVADAIEQCGIPYMLFSGFSSNPVYEDVCAGTRKFMSSGCDGILAIGGGSAIDVAKCISIFCALRQDKSFIGQGYVPRTVPLIAVPTTAGTGSESTSFAVIYKDGIKLSVGHDSMIPDVVFLDSSLLSGLPLYQKKSTVMDALCQALESWWSVKSTAESIGLSKQAVSMISDNVQPYLSGDREAAKNILRAANLSGQAINITQTTAPHAMSYKMTSLYGISHGHAVALGFPKVWRHMFNHLEVCIDKRGQVYLLKIFDEMAGCMGYPSICEAVAGFEDLLHGIGLTVPKTFKEEDIPVLVESVNIERLNNNPVKLDQEAISRIYKEIFQGR